MVTGGSFQFCCFSFLVRWNSPYPQEWFVVDRMFSSGVCQMRSCSEWGCLSGMKGTVTLWGLRFCCTSSWRKPKGAPVILGTTKLKILLLLLQTEPSSVWCTFQLWSRGKKRKTAVGLSSDGFCWGCYSQPHCSDYILVINLCCPCFPRLISDWKCLS